MNIFVQSNNKDNSIISDEKKLGYLCLDIICSSKLKVFLELRSRKTVRVSEQIMSADKYPSISLPQMEAIVFISVKEQVEVTLIFSLLITLLCLHDFFWMVNCLHAFFFRKNFLYRNLFFGNCHPPPGFLMVRPLDGKIYLRQNERRCALDKVAIF